MRRILFSTYVGEKTYAAVLALISDWPLRKRLEYAADSLFRLTADDFDDPKLARQWRAIHDDLVVFDPEFPGDGRIAATTRNLIEYDASKLADRILQLFFDVIVYDWNRLDNQQEEE